MQKGKDPLITVVTGNFVTPLTANKLQAPLPAQPAASAGRSRLSVKQAWANRPHSFPLDTKHPAAAKKQT